MQVSGQRSLSHSEAIQGGAVGASCSLGGFRRARISSAWNACTFAQRLDLTLSYTISCQYRFRISYPWLNKNNHPNVQPAFSVAGSGLPLELHSEVDLSAPHAGGSPSSTHPRHQLAQSLSPGPLIAILALLILRSPIYPGADNAIRVVNPNRPGSTHPRCLLSCPPTSQPRDTLLVVLDF